MTGTLILESIDINAIILVITLRQLYTHTLNYVNIHIQSGTINQCNYYNIL